MALLNDICRCHNDECPERGSCLRWLERESGYVHTSFLNLSENECPHWLGATAPAAGGERVGRIR